MSKKPGSLFGGILLITGSCIGAGMLGLPILTGLAGFFPSLAMFFVVWLFMMTTGLLLVEANSWFSKKVNFISMVELVLGKWGKGLCLTLYLFLFYALLVAYISGSGSLFSTLLQHAFQIHVPSWSGSILFVVLFGVIVFLGTRQVDLWNRFLMAAKIVFFLCLIAIGARSIEPTLLTYSAPSLAIFSLPILVISFGFHNMVPTLTSYVHQDFKKVRKIIYGGSLFTFFIYLIWEILVLGIVPIEGPHGLIETFKLDQEGAQALSSILKSPWITLFAEGLAFFAILTSFLAQALSLVHFLADGLKISYQKREPFRLCLLVLIPPLVLSLFWPKLFFKALNFAGGFCAVILFGILPALMVWIGRYRKKTPSSYTVPGGKALLLFIFAFACFTFLFQLLNSLDILNLAKGLHE